MARASGDAGPLVLVCGEDEFPVRQRARAVWDCWCAGASGMDQEILDASAGTVDEALKRLGKLREALQTLPFFGGPKLVWFRDCTFLGEDRTSQAAAVTAALGDLAEELKAFSWDGVRLLISAGKADKRRSFFKTLAKLGTVEEFAALSDDRDWADRVEAEALRQFKAAGKTVADDALTALVGRVGPNLRALANEVEKLALHAGDRASVSLADVELLVPVQKLAAGFALADAVGDRDLPRALRMLDEELWTLRSGLDKRKSEIGLVYGLISKVRLLLLMKELRRLGVVRPSRDFRAFRAQVAALSDSRLPQDRRYNPIAGSPYPAFQALRQCEKWELPELVGAMDVLLEANIALVASGLDEAVVLQRAVVALLPSDTRGGSASPGVRTSRAA
ncbi:MAG: DNA polymerase III subunit delta [Verrucomicrobiae bacterium]|nr:DNA polymerase III subunit delta [Verrucomicrobiae bacterium]